MAEPCSFELTLSCDDTTIAGVVLDVHKDGSFLGSTRAEIKLPTFPGGAAEDSTNWDMAPYWQALRTNGYYAPGDGGHALYSRVATQPSHPGAIQTADGSWWEIVCDNGEIVDRSLGVKGDGVTDDTQALQDAIDTAQALCCTLHSPYADNGIRATGSLRITKASQIITGPGVRGGDPGVGWFLDNSTGNVPLLEIRAPSVHIDGLSLKGAGRSVANSVVIDASEDGFDGADNGNVDLYIRESRISSASTLVLLSGRGLYASENNFVDFGDVFEIVWPQTFVSGGNVDQTAITGMRAYQLVNNRFHAGSGGTIFINEGANSENLRGLHFSDNYIDTLTRIFRGKANYSTFSDNTLINSSLANNPVFEFTGGNHVNVRDNVITGMVDNGNGATREISKFVSMAECKLINISGNQISRVVLDPISIGPNCSKVHVRDNMFSDVMLSSSAGSLRGLVRLDSNSDYIQITDNTVCLDGQILAGWNPSYLLYRSNGTIVCPNHFIGNNQVAPIGFFQTSTDNVP